MIEMVYKIKNECYYYPVNLLLEDKKMKKFIAADVEIKELKDTSYGPHNNTVQDSVKTAILDSNGKVIGWKTKYGESSEEK